MPATVSASRTPATCAELARRSDLRIIAVCPDREKVAAARKAIDAAGLYGVRISIERWPLDAIPYADYFADLIVSESALVTGDLPPASVNVLRMLRPIGGALVVGQPAANDPASESLDAESCEKRDDFAVAVHSWRIPLVVLGGVRCGERRLPNEEFVVKPYHYGPLIRKIEALITKSRAA